MTEITFTAEELGSVKNKQIQRLIAGKLEKALKEALEKLKNDQTAKNLPNVKAYLELLEKVEAAKPTKKTRTKKTKQPAAP